MNAQEVESWSEVFVPQGYDLIRIIEDRASHGMFQRYLLFPKVVICQNGFSNTFKCDSYRHVGEVEDATLSGLKREGELDALGAFFVKLKTRLLAD
jgi:hypothetical protein